MSGTVTTGTTKPTVATHGIKHGSDHTHLKGGTKQEGG